MNVSVRAVQPVATFDEFLADPLIRAELEAIFDTPDIKQSPGSDGPLAILKVREDAWDKKRTRLAPIEAAEWLLARWREARP